MYLAYSVRATSEIVRRFIGGSFTSGYGLCQPLTSTLWLVRTEAMAFLADTSSPNAIIYASRAVYHSGRGATIGALHFLLNSHSLNIQGYRGIVKDFLKPANLLRCSIPSGACKCDVVSLVLPKTHCLAQSILRTSRLQCGQCWVIRFPSRV